MTGSTTLLQCDWIAPMDAPILRDGGVVVVAGKIAAVGPAGSLRAAYPGAVVTDLRDSILLPGLVNAHAHLELSNYDPAMFPGERNLPGWVSYIIDTLPRDAESALASTTHGTRKGIAQCLRFGVTSVGDISRDCMITRPLLQDGPLRVVSYGEVRAMAQRRQIFEQLFALAISETHASEYLRIGISPHSPYSVEPEAYRQCLKMARERGLPIATHLAETRDEAEFLASHSGPLKTIWDKLQAWDDRVPRYAGGPIRLARDLGLLDHPTLLAHVNFCDDDELEILASGRASVVYCPRTHAYFGHPPHRWRDMLARGINVAVGTDSCASSPDLNLVDDLRLMHRIAPEMPPQTLWEMATTRAAVAIQQDHRVGSITPGKFADLVAFPSTGNDPLRDILQTPVLPNQIWIGGELMRTA